MSGVERQRRLAAVMITDIVGYTALTQQDEDLMLDLLEEHTTTLRGLFAAHGGREIKSTGDGFLVEFTSALAATQCAMAIQQAVTERNQEVDSDRRIQVRVGLHVGEIVSHGDDILGDGVNIASRIERLAPPGGIALSQQVYDQVHARIDAELVSLGKQQLKNVRIPVEVYQIVPRSSTRTTPAADASERTRIAVLPLANYSLDAADAYFADGMTEELIFRLSQIRRFRVIAHTSVMHYKDARKRIREIGEELGVGAVLEGSVRKAGERVRITAQLVDAHTEEHLWSTAYERELQDVFAIQRDIAHEVAEALEVRLLAGDRRQLAKESTESTEAYTLYLKGRHFWNQRTEEGLERGIEYFQEALEADPSFAPAHAGLADSFAIMTGEGLLPADEGYRLAMEQALEALRKDPDLAEAHVSLAWLLWRHQHDPTQAEREFRQAIRSNPSYTTAHHWYATFLAAYGRFDEALREIQRALELDPLSPLINVAAGQVRYMARQLEEARAHYEAALELALSDLRWHIQLGYAGVCMTDGDFDAAQTALREVEEQTAGHPGAALWVRGLRGIMAAVQGDLEQAHTVRNELAEAAPTGGREWLLGLLCTALGETGQAMDWFAHAWTCHDSNIIWFKVHPALDGIRDHPRYEELLTQMGLFSER